MKRMVRRIVNKDKYNGDIGPRDFRIVQKIKWGSRLCICD